MKNYPRIKNECLIKVFLCKARNLRKRETSIALFVVSPSKMDLSLNSTFHSFHYPSKLTTEYRHTLRSNLLYLNMYRHKGSNFLITRTTYAKFKVTENIPRCTSAKSTVFDRKFKYETKKNRVMPKR